MNNWNSGYGLVAGLLVLGLGLAACGAGPDGAPLEGANGGVPEQTAEPDLYPVGRTPTPDPADPDVETYTATSPDGKWQATGTLAFPSGGGEGAGDTYYTRLSVAGVPDGPVWTLVEGWSQLGLGYTVPRPFAWSRGGGVFYYTNRPVVDGCSLYVNGSDLWRVDLSNGFQRQVVPSVGLWLALSPDESLLAYIAYGDRGLVVRDLRDGSERAVRLDPGGPYQAGEILWSPDGERLALILAHEPCTGGELAAAFSVLSVDLDTMELQTLVPPDERSLTLVAWPEGEGIALESREGGRWWLDPQTGDLIER